MSKSCYGRSLSRDKAVICPGPKHVLGGDPSFRRFTAGLKLAERKFFALRTISALFSLFRCQGFPVPETQIAVSMRREFDTKLLKLQVIPCAGSLQEWTEGVVRFHLATARI